MMGFGFLKDNHPLSTDSHKELVTGFNMQGLASLTWDHNLVFC